MERRRIILIPLLLIIINFILKILFIDAQSIAGDEPFSIYHAQMDVPSLIRQLTQGNNPPLFEILLHYWMKLFGIGPFSVRFLPLLFSTLTVLFIFKIGIRFFNYHTAWIASLLYTFSNYHIYFSHEARVYSLFALLTSISMFAFLQLVYNPESTRYKIILILSNSIIIYAHYLGFFIIFIQGCSILLVKKSRPHLLKQYIYCLSAVLLLYLPLLKVFIFRFWSSSSGGTWLKPPEGIDALYEIIRKFSNQPVTAVIFIAVMISSLVKWGYNKDYRNTSDASKVIAMWFLFPFLGVFAVSFAIPMFLDRYLVFLSIGFYLLLAVSIHYLSISGKARVVLSSICVALMVITCNPDVDNQRHVKETIGKIRELKNEGSVVLFCPVAFSLNFTYYYDLGIFKDYDTEQIYRKMTLALNKEKVYPMNHINEMNKDSLSSAKRIIYLDAAADFSHPDNKIIESLSANYALEAEYKYEKIFRIFVFNTRSF